jgi:hypothetical protein
MGGYAALQLGPNAVNLNGARSGAERVATCIIEEWGCEEDNEDEEGHALNIFGKTGNYYSLLAANE